MRDREGRHVKVEARRAGLVLLDHEGVKLGEIWLHGFPVFAGLTKDGVEDLAIQLRDALARSDVVVGRVP